MRDIIALACTECKRRNYSTTKNKKKTSERLELSKFCRFCRKHIAASRNEVAFDSCSSAAARSEPAANGASRRAASERRVGESEGEALG